MAKNKRDGKNLGGRPEEWDSARLEQEAIDLLAWAKGEESLVLREFFAYRGYTQQRAHDLFKKESEGAKRFAEAYEIAKTIIGARREAGALRGELTPSTVEKGAPMYDPDYKAYLIEMKLLDKQVKDEEERARLKSLAEAIDKANRDFKGDK